MALVGMHAKLLRRYGRMPMNREPLHVRARETAKFLHGLFYGLKIFGCKTLQFCASRRESLIRHAETCPDSPEDILQLVTRPKSKELGRAATRMLEPQHDWTTSLY